MVALDGSSALDLVNRKKPDLILLDVIMPGMNGFKVCRKLKSDKATHSIPIIFISGKKETGSRSIGMELGAVDYITKPFTAENLLNRILNQLEENPETAGTPPSRNSISLSIPIDSRRINENLIPNLLFRMAYSAEIQGGLPEAHPIRVAIYSALLGKEIGLDTHSINYLIYASALHDLGKSTIPSRILQKPDSLDFDEWEIMKSHCVTGENILSGTNDPFLNLAAGIARSHHEFWNGTGYPDQLKGDEIPLESRICHLTDSFDSMRCDKIYSEKIEKEKCLHILEKEKGLKYDPTLAESLISISDDFFYIEKEIQDFKDIKKMPDILEKMNIDYISLMK